MNNTCDSHEATLKHIYVCICIIMYENLTDSWSFHLHILIIMIRTPISQTIDDLVKHEATINEESYKG